MKKVKSNGYMALFIPGHPHSFGRGYVYEHRYLMECKIGRYLEKKEIVHHLDGNKTNNDIDNLELCNSISEHKIYHRNKESKLRIPGEENVIIKCACGCGNEFPKFDSSGRERTYHKGCSLRTKVSKDKKQIRELQKVNCECGCGMEIYKYDKYGRVRKYLPGHNSKHEFTKTLVAINTGYSYATINNYFNNEVMKNKTILTIENYITKNHGKNYLRA